MTDKNLYTVTEIRTGMCSNQFYDWSGNTAVVGAVNCNEELCIAPGAELKVVEQVTKKEHIWKITLSFTTSKEFSGRPDLQGRAYQVTTDNACYLIGCNTRPYPITKVTRIYAGKASANKMTQVQVTWTIPRPLPKLD